MASSLPGSLPELDHNLTERRLRLPGAVSKRRRTRERTASWPAVKLWAWAAKLRGKFTLLSMVWAELDRTVIPGLVRSEPSTLILMARVSPPWRMLLQDVPFDDWRAELPILQPAPPPLSSLLSVVVSSLKSPVAVWLKATTTQ